MDVSGVDLDAEVTAVNHNWVEGFFSGADVAFTRERSHSDGVCVLEQRHVVAQGSIHVKLKGFRWLIKSDSLKEGGCSVLF